MTTAFENLLYIYGDAICGRKTILPENCDREAIAKKAIEQNILPLIYFNLFGEETNNRYYALVMQSLANNERRMFFIFIFTTSSEYTFFIFVYDQFFKTF